jgi:hypothetical protein
MHIFSSWHDQGNPDAVAECKKQAWGHQFSAPFVYLFGRKFWESRNDLIMLLFSRLESRNPGGTIRIIIKLSVNSGDEIHKLWTDPDSS